MRSLNAVLDEGHDVIFDVVCAGYDPRSFEELLSIIKDHEIFTVAVQADLKDLEQCESQRDDRKAGLAKSQIEGHP